MPNTPILSACLALIAASLSVQPHQDVASEDPAAGPTLHARGAHTEQDEMQTTNTIAAIAAQLDDLHAAAAEADEARYFDHFATTVEGPVFIGTDATERWTLPEFRAFAKPYFAAGKAWTYTPLERHIELDAATPNIAWFDELLSHASYGTLRGSGVLIRRDGRWRVAQYVLSFCVPNAVAGEVVELIGKTDAGKSASE